MTAEQKKKEQRANWEKLPENKPAWDAWQRLLEYYHSERHAWFMWTAKSGEACRVLVHEIYKV